MVITICGSMIFGKEMIEKKLELEALGYEVYISAFAHEFGNVSEDRKLELNKKHIEENDAIRDHYQKILKSDAILVLNYDRKGIKNYIGGNSFLEIGFAYVLHKAIYLLNPIPEIELYSSEIANMKPIVLNGDLKLIK